MPLTAVNRLQSVHASSRRKAIRAIRGKKLIKNIAEAKRLRRADPFKAKRLIKEAFNLLPSFNLKEHLHA